MNFSSGAIHWHSCAWSAVSLMFRFLKIIVLAAVPAFALNLTSDNRTMAQYIGADSPVGLPKYVCLDGTSIDSGRAICIQWFRSRKLLLAPYHCTQGDPSKIASVKVFDLTRESVVADAGPPLLSGGKNMTEAGDEWSQDLMAYEISSNTHLPLLPMASSTVSVGTKVWILSKELPSKERQPDRLPGVVTLSEPTQLQVMFDRKLAPALSGSPIVNAKGELVGMYLAVEQTERKRASAAPATAIYARLYKQLGNDRK